MARLSPPPSRGRKRWSQSILGLLIGGEWRQTAAARPNRNPSDPDDVIGDYAQGSAADVDDAVAAATVAQRGWATASPQVRADTLEAVATELLARRAELGDLLAREEGKTLAEASGEVARAGQIFRFFAGEAVRGGGEWLPSLRPGVTVEVRHEPMGVVGLITPWNFPIAIPAWKTAPALAFGNAVLLKPADLVPGSAWALAEILHRHLPAGVFNLVMGRGASVGQAMLDHPGIAAISFTGGTDTGLRVATATAARGARCQLEMGGKNPLVVLDDADLDNAVDCAVQGSFYSTGQRCTASSRIIVTAGIADRFVARLADVTSALRVGDARAPDTQIGPLADEAQLAKTIDYVALGRAEGAVVIAGGERLPGKGWFHQPTLFDHAAPTMRLAREEIFGPVASVQRVADYDAALAAANDSDFGLSAGICTTSLRHAEHFKAQAQAGMVMVNLPTAGVDYHVPFGGWKASNLGPREQGSHARAFYTQVKTAYTRS